MDVKFIRDVGVGSVAIGFVIGIIASIVKKRERKINYFGVRTSKKKKERSINKVADIKEEIKL